MKLETNVQQPFANIIEEVEEVGVILVRPQGTNRPAILVLALQDSDGVDISLNGHLGRDAPKPDGHLGRDSTVPAGHLGRDSAAPGGRRRRRMKVQMGLTIEISPNAVITKAMT